MSLIVEDGSCVPNAESYAAVDDADQYFALRGMSAWASLTTDQKEQALRRATDFMVARFRSSWSGCKVKFDQELDWPRASVVIDHTSLVPLDTVPKDIKRACMELALKAAAGPLVEDATQKVIQETVGPITTKYDVNSPTTIRYSQVDMMLAPYLRAGGNSAMVKLARR